MLAYLSTLFVAVAALAGVTAAPASNNHLVARECPGRRPYVTLNGHSWIKIEALDKNPTDYYEDVGPFAREFAFYKPDGYEMEHFKLISYKGDGEWRGMDTANLQEDGVYDVSLSLLVGDTDMQCRISAIGGVPDIYCAQNIHVWVGGDVYNGIGTIIPECVPWGQPFTTIPGYS